jgi:hypothetical protein
MPRPKKDEIFATYNNDFCYEKGLSELRKIEPKIEIDVLDYHTIKILVKNKDPSIERTVKTIVKNTKGYVEVELDTINALKVHNKKDQQQNSGVLDTPFYG